MPFVVFNNEVIPIAKLNFYNVERFRYADACFESMLYINNEIPLLAYHQNRLDETALFLEFEPYKITLNKITELIENQKESNKIWRIRLSLIRAEGLNYFPKGNKVHTLIECQPLPAIFKQIKNVGFYNEIPKPINLFSSYKTANALLYVKAKQYASNNNFDDVLLKNSSNNWIEATASNIFAVKDNTIYTPQNNSGQVQGVCSVFLQKHFNIKQVDFNSIFLNEVNELFLTNGIQIIQSVATLNNRKLETVATQKVINKVDQILKF